MSCDSTWATAQQFADFWCLDDICAEEKETIEHFLDIAAYDIFAALASTGACDCTLASWAGGYLAKLNIIEAAAYYNCPCANPRMSTERKQMFLDWASGQLEMLANGKLDVCDGHTGSQYPVIGWAQQSVTEFAAAEIIVHDILENS